MKKHQMSDLIKKRNNQIKMIDGAMALVDFLLQVSKTKDVRIRGDIAHLKDEHKGLKLKIKQDIERLKRRRSSSKGKGK
jgi:hypothetical protein